MRSQGHDSVVYVDDSYLQGDTYKSCFANVLDIIKLLRELGFVVHPDKSALTLSETIVFLRFAISSKHMKLSLTDENKNKIKTLLSCLHSPEVSVRQLAGILGNGVASFPAVNFGPFHCGNLESDRVLNITR